jgi:hypothetical protein
MGIQEQFSEEMVCPTTAQTLIVERFIVEPILGGLAGIAVWWTCPVCQCWHMSEVKPIEARIESFVSSQQKVSYQPN